MPAVFLLHKKKESEHFETCFYFAHHFVKTTIEKASSVMHFYHM